MFKAVLLIVAGLLLFVMADFGGEPRQFPTVYDMPPAENANPVFSDEAIKQSARVLRNNCKVLFFAAVDDVVKASSFHSEAYPYMTEKYGWTDMIVVNVQLKDRLKSISPQYHADGHLLTFYLGSGTKSGVITDKRQAQQICGWEESGDGSSMFHEIPELNVLKKAG